MSCIILCTGCTPFLLQHLAFGKMAYAILPCLHSETFRRYGQQNAKFCLPLGFSRGRPPTRISFCRPSRTYAGSIGGPTPGQLELQGEDAEEPMQNERKFSRSSWIPTLFKMFESAATTFASILVLGLAGYGYHRVRGFLEQELSLSDYPSNYKPWSRSNRPLMPVRAVVSFGSMPWRRDADPEMVLVL